MEIKRAGLYLRIVLLRSEEHKLGRTEPAKGELKI